MTVESSQTLFHLYELFCTFELKSKVVNEALNITITADVKFKNICGNEGVDPAKWLLVSC